MVKGDIDLTEHRDFKLDKDDVEKKYLPDISRKPWYDKYNPTSMELKTEFNSLETQIARSLYRIYNDIDDSWQTFNNIGSYNFESRVNRIFEVFDEYIDNDYSDHYNDIYNILDVHFNRVTASLTYTYNSIAYNSDRRVTFNAIEDVYREKYQDVELQKARELIEKLFGPKKKPLKQLSIADDRHNYSKCYYDHGFIIGDCPKCNKKIYDAPTEIRDIKFKNISVEEKYMSDYDVEPCISEICYTSEILESLSSYIDRYIHHRNNPNIPWLNKLSRDNYDDYMTTLHGEEEKDYSDYLTST